MQANAARHGSSDSWSSHKTVAIAPWVAQRAMSPEMRSSSRSRRSSTSSKLQGPLAKRNSTLLPSVRRWDGESRTSSSWDNLRRDDELWLPGGDCFVHLHAKGNSRRGPAFCIPAEALHLAQCDALFDLVVAEASPEQPTTQWQLHLPAPEYYSRREAFQYHLTTRNFFAFLFGKPLVGTHLGRALVDLQSRLAQHRAEPDGTFQELRGYAEAMGYMDLAHCPDNALAMLHYAEQFHLRDLWIDAFSHCVGMNEELCLSEEFALVDKYTKSQITKSFLEIGIHLERIEQSVFTFLETEMSSSTLGLTSAAREHLDRFRSFLHNYYMSRYGYWPPTKTGKFNKELHTTMYFDFRNLYDYIVDLESTQSISTLKPASGGICVLQNVTMFNKRNKYDPLPHPMPLLPVEPKTKPTLTRTSAIMAKMNTTKAKVEEYKAGLKSLLIATNSISSEASSSGFLRAYVRFERECCERNDEKISLTEARKVRWLLTYSILQMLIYAVRAPKEVRSTANVSYPLCCLHIPTPPWNAASKANSILSWSGTDASLSSESSIGLIQEPSSAIEPDFDASYYFTADRCSPGLESTEGRILEMPSPIRMHATSQLLKSTSMRLNRRLSYGPFARREPMNNHNTSAQLDDTLLRAYENARINDFNFDLSTGASDSQTTRDESEIAATFEANTPASKPSTPNLTIEQLNAIQEFHRNDSSRSATSDSSSQISSMPSPLFSSVGDKSSPSSVSSLRRDSIDSTDLSNYPSPPKKSAKRPTLERHRPMSNASSVYSTTIPKTPTAAKETWNMSTFTNANALKSGPSHNRTENVEVNNTTTAVHTRDFASQSSRDQSMEAEVTGKPELNIKTSDLLPTPQEFWAWREKSQTPVSKPAKEESSALKRFSSVYAPSISRTLTGKTAKVTLRFNFGSSKKDTVSTDSLTTIGGRYEDIA